MARGGISKVLVKQARDALLARGVNPSIDTVRIELGNTGSKTTIHRHLKELEEEEGTRLDDESLLSATLKDMVARLASRLHEEAHAIVEQEQAKHRTSTAQLEERNKAQAQELNQAQQRIKDLESRLSNFEKLFTDSQTENQQLRTQVERLHQQVEDQHLLLAQKDNQIQSLEEKHQHARDALTHYRDSMKEQRDQDQRRHEHQVQQLQAEQRQLNQTLSVKQSEITQLNTDNTRLLTQLSEARKSQSTVENKVAALENQAKLADENADFYKRKLNELPALQDALATAETTLKQQALDLAGLRSELATKNQIFEKLGLT